MQLSKAAESALIRVLIADDHPVVCLGLVGIINGQPDMTVVGQAKTGIEAVALARQHTLSVYDAAYLELALRRGAALATLDGPLRMVAKKLGVPILPKKLPDES